MFNKALLLGMIALGLAGCATSTRYISYTTQQFPPKDALYTINIYPPSQALPASNPYYVIGKISIEGFASNGVGPESLANQAKAEAKKRGADAIINARTEIFRYYGDALFRFNGELIIYAPVATAK